MRELYETYKTWELKDAAQREEEDYMQHFLKIYSPIEDYVVVTDSCYLNEFFLNFNNVKYIPKIEVVSVQKKRKEYIKETIFDLMQLSLCDTIYKTYGNFVNLAAAFSPDNKRIQHLN
jgi:hypothetical protein